MNSFFEQFNLKDAIIAILVVMVAFLYIDKPDYGNQIKGSDFERLEDNIVRAQTKIVKDVVLNEVSKEIESRISENNVKLFGQIKGIVEGNRVGRKSDNDESTLKYKREKKDLYWKYEQDGSIKKFPIGTVIYDPKNENNPWLGLTYGLNFDTKIVQQKKYDGTYETFVETWATHKNLKESHGGGGRYPIKIDSAEFQIKEPNQLVFSWWNPTLSLGLGTTSINNYGVFGKFNFINYGYERQLPVFQFLSPSFVVENNKIGGALEIGSVNIGEYVPVIKDLHIGAGIMIPDYKKPFISVSTTF
jgi:hypothetical protein